MTRGAAIQDPCPACSSSSLAAFDVSENVRVELCQGCKGMLVDERALEGLAGPCELEAILEPCGELAHYGPCLRCNTSNWQRRAPPGVTHVGLGLCATCGMLWLKAGALERLQRELALKRRRALASAARVPVGAPSTSISPLRAAPSRPIEPLAGPSAAVEERDRIPFDRGVGNLLGVPLALSFSLLFCAGPAGRFFGSLVGMPFHELGHALASWLSSRFAMPLPFFTIWAEEQSLVFGAVVATLLAYFGFHSWQERSRFGVSLAVALLSMQVAASWLVPTRTTAMFQILGGALGEIVIGALLLIAFHFPLPDRLRWDFWRWPALLPGAVCFAQAMWLWMRAARDTSQMPWGSAIGSASDGDMNRLVADFGWSATELASFYLKATWLSAAALCSAYAWALKRRPWRKRRPGARHLPG